MPSVRLQAAAATLVNALASIAPQIAALLLLSPSKFGAFSLLYLIYALGSSVSFSVVCEPPIRSRLRRNSDRGHPDDQLATALWLSLAFGLIAAAITVFLVHSVDIVAAIAVAVAAATFRVSARYREVLQSRWTTALRADSVGLVVFCAAVGGFLAAGAEPLRTVVLSWALGMLATALTGVHPAVRAPSVVVRWVQHHRVEIRDLLGESVVLDAGAIGGPYLVAPLLGLSNFGVYRGISNVAAPVRLVLNPLRPQLATMSQRPHRLRVLRRLIIGLAVAVAAAAWVVLFVIQRSGAHLGVLTALGSYSVAAGMFVGLNLLGHFEYLVARPAACRRQLVLARAVQSGTVFTLPLIGAVVWGLDGAIWGLVMATIFGAAAWVIVGRHPHPTEPPKTAHPGSGGPAGED